MAFDVNCDKIQRCNPSLLQYRVECPGGYYHRLVAAEVSGELLGLQTRVHIIASAANMQNGGAFLFGCRALKKCCLANFADLGAAVTVRFDEDALPT